MTKEQMVGALSPSQVEILMVNLLDLARNKEELRAVLRRRIAEDQEALDLLGEAPKPKRGRRPKAKVAEVK